MKTDVELTGISTLAETAHLHTTNIVQNCNSYGTYSIKSAYNIKGITTSNNSKILAYYVPTYTASVVTLLEAAGEYCKYTVTHDSHCMGIGDNGVPSYYKGIPLGGSSFGSAYSLLDDITLQYSLCSDTYGSLVLPCTQARLYGFKGSRGYISRRGLHEYCPWYDRVSIMAKSLCVLERISNILHIKDPLDPYTLAWQQQTQPLLVYVEKDILLRYFPSATLCSIDFTTLHAKASAYISAYAYSSLNRYDGIRFNHGNHNAVYDNTQRIKNRDALLTKKVKRRIIKGCKYVPNLVAPDIIKLLNIPHGIIILEHTVAKDIQTIYLHEARYGLANTINYCSISIPVTDTTTLEFMAPAGYQTMLYTFVTQFIESNNA